MALCKRVLHWDKACIAYSELHDMVVAIAVAPTVIFWLNHPAKTHTPLSALAAGRHANLDEHLNGANHLSADLGGQDHNPKFESQRHRSASQGDD